jgi:hypothetical protein
VLHATFSDIGGAQNVRVVAQYYKKTRTGAQASTLVTVNVLVSSNGTRIDHQLPLEPASDTEGGIHSIYRLQIYSVDGSGNAVALLRDSRVGIDPVGLVWTATTDLSVTAHFRYKRAIVDPTYSEFVTATRFGSQFAA